MAPLRRLLFVLGVVAATVGLLAVGVPTAAQDATQTPTPAQGAAVEAHPVAIHQGTCQQPSPEPAYDIGEARPFIGDDDQVIPQEQYQGTLTAPPVLTSGIGIDANLDDLLGDTPYVVLVHESAQAYQSYIACGEIGGPVVGDELVVALRPLNNSGYAGTATLRRDGDQTTGNLYVFGQVLGFTGGQAGPTPTPAPSPTPGPSPMPTPSPTPAPTDTPQPPPPTPTPATMVPVTATPTG